MAAETIGNTKDRRVDKTLRALSTALLDLSKTKSFQKISVRDLCDHAMVNRSTFYMHFEDKYQLLTYVLTQISYECTAKFMVTGEKPLLSLMANSNYKDLYAEVLDNAELNHLLHEFIVQDIKQQLKDHYADQMSDVYTLNITSEYYAGAIISVLNWWLKKGSDLPLAQLSEHFNTLPSPFGTLHP